jgi:hypothetical protein
MTASKAFATPATATWLGRAGLLPFCLLPLLLIVSPRHETLCLKLLANYSLAILCFLPGAWWGMGLIRRQSQPLLLSNALVVLAFFARSFLSDQYFLLVAVALFVAILAYERRHPMFKPQPAYYARLRIQLTGVACAGLLLAALAASLSRAG